MRGWWSHLLTLLRGGREDRSWRCASAGDPGGDWVVLCVLLALAISGTILVLDAVLETLAQVGRALTS